MTSAAQKRYVAKSRDKVLAAKRRWNNSVKGRSARSAWQRSDEGKAWYRAEYHRLRGLVLDGYGRACACCGEREVKFLAIDHVHGGGRSERKKIGCGAFLFSRIIKQGFPAEYQLLCHNCNMAKGLYGVCPHKEAPALKVAA